MSRCYEMDVEISGFDPEQEPQIRQAAEDEWPFDNWWSLGHGNNGASAEGTLCGGESEELFTQRLSIAIWQANGGFCEVVVKATYLEDLPCEIHALDEDDYARLITSGETR